jgi:hypothetical protein
MVENFFNISNMSTTMGMNEFILIYVYPPVTFISLVLNLFNFVIFSNQECQNQGLFVYLKLQSLCISVDMVICSLGPFYVLSKSQLKNILNLYATGYVEDVLEKSELALSLLAARSCLKLMSQATPQHSDLLKASQRRQAYLISAGLFLLLSLTTAHKLFQYEIRERDNSYKNKKSDFGNSKLYKDLEIASFALNNVLFLLILIFLDLKIIKKSRSNVSLKVKMTSDSENRMSSIQARESQDKLTKMIVIDCANTIACHLVIVFYYLLKSTLSDGFPYDPILWLVVYSSYIGKFFIYFQFNKKFRLNANQKLAKLKFLVLRR